MAKPPSELIEAFRVDANKDIEAIACLLIDDGFDAETMRVLAAWLQVDHPWRKPPTPCPDGGKPTAAAWRWLVRGLEMNWGDLAAAAGVTRPVARAKSAMLLGNRLALPDGSISNTARASLQQHAREALGLKAKKAVTPKADVPGTN